MLTPIITACKTCKSITIKDITGFYNVTTNPEAWDDVLTLFRNSTLGSPYAVTAELDIYFNDVLTDTIDVLPTINAAVFPEYELYEYTPVDLDGNSNLQDGLYEFILTITGSDDEVYTASIIIPTWCNVECCVAKLASDVADELCNPCDSEAYDKFLLANTILEALKATADCLGEAAFTKLLNKLKKLCGQSITGGCGCGCS
jgi:hypothetical protein